MTESVYELHDKTVRTNKTLKHNNNTQNNAQRAFVMHYCFDLKFCYIFINIFLYK